MTPLRQRMLDALRLRGMAARTQEAYIEATARLAVHYRCSPELLSADQVQAYLLHLLAVVGPPSGSFVEVPMPRSGVPVAEPIRLELRRGASTVSLQWPATAAAECGAWLREWLR